MKLCETLGKMITLLISAVSEIALYPQSEMSIYFSALSKTHLIVKY